MSIQLGELEINVQLGTSNKLIVKYCIKPTDPGLAQFGNWHVAPEMERNPGDDPAVQTMNDAVAAAFEDLLTEVKNGVEFRVAIENAIKTRHGIPLT